VLLIHLQPNMIEEQPEDMTTYVTDCLRWAQERMVELLTEDRHDDAIALGAEFLAWADETEDMVYCSPNFSDYES